MIEKLSSKNHKQEAIEDAETKREIISFDDLIGRLHLDPQYIQEKRSAPVRFGEEKRPYVFLRKEWKTPRFDAQKYLEQQNAPFVEVAGPTASGYTLIDLETLKKSGKKMLVSNLFPGLPQWKGNDVTIQKGGVDFQSDTTELSIKNNSAGALFCSRFSYLPPKPKSVTGNEWQKRSADARLQVIKEAWRTLQDGGLLVWQGGQGIDVVQMAQIGFEPMDIAADLVYGSKEEPAYHAIFKKPKGAKTQTTRFLGNEK